MLSDQEMAASANQQFAKFMSDATQKQAVLSVSESPQAASAIAMVNRVSQKIVDAAGMRGRANWEVTVVKSKSANAFVLPNGKIVVYTGILPIAKTEGGLAAVLGHEVAHVVARHSAERASQMLVANTAVSAAMVALAASSRSSSYASEVGAALGLGAQYGVILPFSRKHESEADHMGMFYMAKAGYDPSEAIGLWERMEAANGTGPWELLSTHPSNATRRARLQEWLPEAKIYYANPSRPLPVTLAEARKAALSQSSQMALAPVALQPTVKPGYWYKVKGSNRPGPDTIHVDRLQACSAGQCVVFARDDGGATIATQDQTQILETRNADGSWTRFSPGLPVFRFPLRVGDTWSATVSTEDSKGVKSTVGVKSDVVGYEPVSVPAGQFIAYRVVLAVNGVRVRESWYVPEVRSSVRVVIYDNKGDQTSASEMLDYQKSDEPADSMPEVLAPLQRQAELEQAEIERRKRQAEETEQRRRDAEQAAIEPQHQAEETERQRRDAEQAEQREREQLLVAHGMQYIVQRQFLCLNTQDSLVVGSVTLTGASSLSCEDARRTVIADDERKNDCPAPYQKEGQKQWIGTASCPGP
jgi:Zn-dependent protease with chaperone function